MKLNIEIHQDKNMTYIFVISIQVLIFASDFLNFDMEYKNNLLC